MPDLQTLETNGIRLRAAVEGDGPLVIMVHGFPELWYSWRHQIRPLARAGYRVVALDLRGYGGSTKPRPVEAYAMTSLMADVIGVIDAFGEQTAILVGHDWGAPICWNTAALHADRVAAVAGLSVPYRKRGATSAIALWRRLYRDKFFYQLYFQEPGVAEAELGADHARTLRMIYYGASGEGAGTFIAEKPADAKMLDGLVDPDPLPSFITADDVATYAAAYAKSGWHGPINRYRAQGLDAADLGQIDSGDLTQPAAFVGGELDAVRQFMPGLDLFDFAPNHCKDFRGSTIVPGVGHWVQQEAPDATNAALDEFLDAL
jgi:pimeloyl-ACP methyl ester carboxylesterase